MLRKEENQLNIYWLYYSSLIYIFPFKLNVASAKLTISRKPYASVIAVSCLIQVHVIYSSFQFFWALKDGLTQVMPYVPLYILLICPPQCAIIQAIKLFLSHSDVTATIFNSSMEPYVGGRMVKRSKNAKRPFFKFSFTEMVTMLLPVLLVPAWLCFCIATIYVDGFWPSQWGQMSNVGNCVLMVIDVINITGWVSYGYFAFHFQLIFMGKVAFVLSDQEAKCRAAINRGKDTFTSILATYKAMRVLQLEVDSFNKCFSSFVFMFKYGALAAVIFSGFGTIQFFRDNILLGTVNAIVVLDGVVLFVIMYGKGFSIPQRFQRLKTLSVLRLKSCPHLIEEQQKIMKRSFSSSRSISINVGNFHRLQRTSTPLFVDFAVKQIARLVMFYRRM